MENGDRPVGELLREWRLRRGLSQLDLSIQAGVSSRHVSFVETGRTIPSAAMVERFAEHMMRIGLHPNGFGDRLLNAQQVRGFLLPRLARQSGDPELRALYDELSAYHPTVEPTPIDPADVALPIRIRHRDTELCFFNTITTFGAPFDITLDEIAVEAYFPSDTLTSDYLHALDPAKTHHF